MAEGPPILLKNSKMHLAQFLADLDRRRELLPRIAAGSVRTILVARSTKSRLPPRSKLNEGSEGLQSFEHLRKRPPFPAGIRPGGNFGLGFPDITSHRVENT